MRFLMYCRIFKIKEYDRENVKMYSHTLGIVTFLDLNAFTIPFLNVLLNGLRNSNRNHW